MSQTNPSPPMLIVTLHGILTNQTDPSWPDKFDAWMYQRAPLVKVLKKEYRAGPLPRWNCWVKDPLLASSLANEIELFLGPGPGESKVEGPTSKVEEERPDCRVWFVAHSNGAVIALLAARRLVQRGYKIGGLILTGAACEADLNKNGLLGWWSQGLLGAAITYSSAEDEVVAGDARAPGSWRQKIRDWVWGKLMWPYGCLGRTGWLWAGKSITEELTIDLRKRTGAGELMGNGEEECGSACASIVTRWYPGGHSRYFTPENIQQTFEQIYQDIGPGQAEGGVRLKSSSSVFLVFLLP